MGGFVTQEQRSPINPPTTLLCNTLLHILTMLNMKTMIVRMMVMRMRMMMICVVITCSVHEDDDHVGDDVKSVTNDKKIAFYLILLEQLAPSIVHLFLAFYCLFALMRFV